MRLIDADALLEYKFPNGFSRWDEQEVVYAVHEKDILSAPTVEAEPTKHGHWTRVDYYPVGHDYICSICDRKHSGSFNFCPDCGAKMDEETEK